MKTANLLRTVAVVVAFMMGVTTALAVPVLTPVGVLTPTSGLPLSWVSAISPDGAYAVGYSAGPNSTGTATINQPVIWSQATGLVQLPNVSDAGFAARGIAVRSNAGKIALSGSPTSGTVVMNTYQAPLSNLTGGSWAQTSYGTTATMGALGTQFNACRLDASSGSAESWYVAGTNAVGTPTPSTGNGLRYGMDGATTAEYQSFLYKAGYYVVGNAVSGNGYMAGSDRGNGTKKLRAVRLDNPGVTNPVPPAAPPAQTVVPGGLHLTSDALGISVNGLKLCGYDTDAAGKAKAFAWTVGDSAMTLLGEVAGDNVSQALVINDSGIVGGYSTDGTNMKAVIWDSTGTWDNTGAPKTVWQLLTAGGVNLSDWSSLTRITSMSDDGMTLAGTGKWAADSSTRSWVLTVPEPATVFFLMVGGLLSLRRRCAA